MLKKTITFKDLDDNDITEDFYFSISKAELAELELSKRGGMEEYLNQIIKDEDGAEIIKAFKMFIRMAYGVRSDDGRRFIKSDELFNEFLQTDAYSVLFMELVTNANAGVQFVAAMMPADLSEKANLLQALDADVKSAIDTVELPEPGKKPSEMTREELLRAYQEKNKN